MYMDVKIGKRGEIVIPAFLRKKMKLMPGKELMLFESENVIELKPKTKDVVAELRQIAKRMNLKEKDLVYGDKLYEEVFG